MRPVVLWLTAITLTGVGVAVTGPAAARARSSARTQAARLEQVDGLLKRISHHREQVPPWATTVSTEASLPERLAAAVSSAGLPSKVLSSVSPGPEEKVPGDLHAIRQRASVSLGSLTLPELGRLLETWRASEPAWVVTGIDLGAETKAKADPGMDLPLRVALTLERVAIGESP
jgi:hypothetical protein